MSLELALHPEALREWHKLDATVRDQFKKKLAERLIEPRVVAHRLSATRSSSVALAIGWSTRCATSSFWSWCLRWDGAIAMRSTARRIAAEIPASTSQKLNPCWGS